MKKFNKFAYGFKVAGTDTIEVMIEQLNTMKRPEPVRISLNQEEEAIDMMERTETTLREQGIYTPNELLMFLDEELFTTLNGLEAKDRELCEYAKASIRYCIDHVDIAEDVR